MSRPELVTIIFCIIVAATPFVTSLPKWLSLVGVLLGAIFIPVFRSHLIGKYKDLFDRILNEDIHYWFRFGDWGEYKKEIDVIHKINIKGLKKPELAKIFRDHRLILKRSNRIKVAFEELCVDLGIKAHKFVVRKEFRSMITSEISDQLGDKEVDLIFLGSSTANNNLKSSLEYRFKKDVFSYSLTKDNTIELSAPEALTKILENTEEKLEYKILVVESALLSPRIVYRLLFFLEDLSKAYDKNFVVSNLVIIFAPYDASFVIKNYTQIQTKIFFEIKKGVIAGAVCTDCHWGKCASEPDIGKAYTLYQIS